MPPSRALAEFVAHLKQAPTASRADAEDWSAHVNRISVPGRITEVSEENYFYWLEMLPPKYQRGSHFCFAEGAESFRFFWQDTESRYRQLTREETVTFCRLARCLFRCNHVHERITHEPDPAHRLRALPSGRPVAWRALHSL